MCGVTSVPFTILAVFLQLQYAKITFASLAVVAWFGTVYKVWATERTRVNQLEKSLAEPDIRGGISEVQFTVPEPYPYGLPRDGTDVSFSLHVCNHSPAKTNIVRVILTVSDKGGNLHSADASVSRPSGNFREVYQGRTAPIMTKLIDVILELGITHDFTGIAHFDEVRPEGLNQESLRAIAVDGAGEYRLPVVATQ